MSVYLKKEEFSAINFSMRVSEEKNGMGQQQAKYFDKSDELDAITIMKKLKGFVEKRTEKGVEGDYFIDGDIDLTTAEKTLIIKCLDRKWDIDNLEWVSAIREKLA